jgi:hypothetical protein
MILYMMATSSVLTLLGLEHILSEERITQIHWVLWIILLGLEHILSGGERITQIHRVLWIIPQCFQDLIGLTSGIRNECWLGFSLLSPSERVSSISPAANANAETQRQYFLP